MRRDLLCEGCAAGNYPRRVDLFPPLGVYGLTARKLANDGRHGSGPPEAPTGPGSSVAQPAPGPVPAGHTAGVVRGVPSAHIDRGSGVGRTGRAERHGSRHGHQVATVAAC